MGHGAYGVVVSALDHSIKAKVAIKKVPKAFEDLIDAKRIVREIKLLKFFDHENIIGGQNVQTKPEPEAEQETQMDRARSKSRQSKNQTGTEVETNWEQNGWS